MNQRGWALVLLLGGCVAPSSVSCPDGRSCPSGTTCATLTTTNGPVGFCLRPDQLGCVAGEACGEAGTCHQGACIPTECGNAFVDLEEVCDDGNQVGGDGCSIDCRSLEVCGNAIVDPVIGEECDAGVPGQSHDSCSSTCRVEVFAWRDVTPAPIGARFGVGAVFDSVNARVIAFGGARSEGLIDETWVWNEQWRPLVVGRSPPGRVYHMMAYDRARHEVVLFGGIGNDYLNDTWVFDGATWTERHPATSPSPRAFATMVYDHARQEVVLYGGIASMTGLNETWVWDGMNWTQRTPAASPPFAGIGLGAYDDARDELVFWLQGSTWIWNGSTWSQRSVSQPTGTGYEAITFDPLGQRVILVGLTSTWAWNGTAWQQVATGGFAPRRDFTLAGTDRGVLLQGGQPASGPLFADTWLLVGSGWLDRTSIPLSPAARGAHATCYDARTGTVVVFGGGDAFNRDIVLGDTCVWFRGSWSCKTPTPGPSARAFHALAYDDGRGRAVLFGGSNRAIPSAPFTAFGDTWTWDGSAWTSSTPAISPTARRLAALAYDRRASRVVLFGGGVEPAPMGAFSVHDDTWLWDGSAWTQAQPATKPPPREGAAMAYDPIRQRVVMYGGLTGSTSQLTMAQLLADTWEWDGATWTAVQPLVSPGPLYRGVMTFDPHRQRIVLAGGLRSIGFVDEIWEWDGTTWSLRVTVQSAGPRESIVYDAVDRRILTFGGYGFAGGTNATRVLEYRSLTEPSERCILGDADEDQDGLAGCADPDCWSVCDPLCSPGIAPCMGPRCGDGTCSSLESPALCAQDCP
ncbi:MAG TPA: kelch repeat-containing protein [Kofleriaceae bacterium]